MPQTNQTKNSANSTLQTKNSANSKHFVKLSSDVLVEDLGVWNFEEVATIGGQKVGDIAINQLGVFTDTYQSKNS